MGARNEDGRADGDRGRSIQKAMGIYTRAYFPEIPYPQHTDKRETELPIWTQARSSSEKEVVLSRVQRWCWGAWVCFHLDCWLTERTRSQSKNVSALFLPLEQVSRTIRASHERCIMQVAGTRQVLPCPWQTAKLSEGSGSLFFSPVLLLKEPCCEKSTRLDAI